MAEGRLPASVPVIGRSRHRSTRRRLVGLGIAAFGVLGLSVAAREDLLLLPLADDRPDERVNSKGGEPDATPMPGRSS